ncbi:hypothetical protein [Chachezhania sediminis]|uniref:hypothetical protein n=1 Tax=Chachezhania sediminis TaxID=2599291 RepID=UPI00131ECE2A|nr:hypothetical protein [Chachezhania sediminis]
MSRLLILVTILAVGLTACGRRERNPAADTNTLIPPKQAGSSFKESREDAHVLIAQITDLKVEQTLSGAIVYAEGQASRLGAYGAELRARNVKVEPDADGVLTLDFVVVYPKNATGTGTTAQRKVMAARSISAQTLERTKLIKVVAGTNTRETRKR